MYLFSRPWHRTKDIVCSDWFTVICFKSRVEYSVTQMAIHLSELVTCNQIGNLGNCLLIRKIKVECDKWRNCDCGTSHLFYIFAHKINIVHLVRGTLRYSFTPRVTLPVFKFMYVWKMAILSYNTIIFMHICCVLR